MAESRNDQVKELADRFVRGEDLTDEELETLLEGYEGSIDPAHDIDWERVIKRAKRRPAIERLLKENQE